MKNRAIKFIRKHPIIAKILVVIFYIPLLKRYGGEIEESISDFSLSRNITVSKRTKKDIVFAMFYNRIAAAEYFLFEFEQKNQYGRRQYIGYLERRAIVAELTDFNGERMLTDKERCYKKYKNYYGRELVKIDKWGPDALGFLEKHPQCIIKPYDSSLGEKVEKIDYQGNLEEAKKMLCDVLNQGPIVMEELICQSEGLGKFHPHSVNSLRVVTYSANPESPVILFSLFRMGIGGSVMDNASAGGILAGVDPDSGIIMTQGFRENGEIYLTHPDTGEQIIGTTIPQWNDLIRTVKALVIETEEVKLVGWDMALTDQGWILIEANYRPSFRGFQMCTRSGIRKTVEKIIGEIDV